MARSAAVSGSAAAFPPSAPQPALSTSPSAPAPRAVALAVLAYSLCSGTLLILNKAVMLLVPSAPLVTALQCLFCVAAIGGASLACGAPRVGALPADMVRAYALYTVLFVLGIYSNMRSLAASNVDTVIVFRAAVPLAVAAGDFLFLGREAPSARSLAAMLVVLVGCAAFVAVDAEFAVNGLAAYFWVSVYFLCIAAEMLFGKQITSKHNASLAASVLLTNGLGLVPFLLIGASTGELAKGECCVARDVRVRRGVLVPARLTRTKAHAPPNAGLDLALFTPAAVAALLASCVLSAGIGFSSWWCRSLVSATSFTMIGVLNKLLTVVLNIVVWEKHSSPLGTAFLLICLFGGAFYQQAPLRLAQPAAFAKLEDAARDRAEAEAAEGSSASVEAVEAEAPATRR